MDDEIKIGAAISAANHSKIQAAHDALADLGAACRSEMDINKSLEIDETVVMFGGEVKSIGDMKIGGYLVRFTGSDHPDLMGDYFAAGTDFDMEFPARTTVYYNHGQDQTLKRRKLGKADLRMDEVGIWAEMQLEARDAYEKYIMEMAEAGKMGWSSGTAAHLVERVADGKSNRITKWPLGLDASLTPTPAEPRNAVIPLKSLIEITPTQAAETAAVASVDEPTQPLEPIIGDTKMDATVETKTVEDRLAELEAKIEAAPAVKQAPAYNKAPLGDDGIKSFINWSRTGDLSGLTPAIKVVDWQVGTAGEGGVVVPDEFYARIVEKRDLLSVMRAAGALRLSISRDKITVPVENEREAAFVATDEEAGYDQGNTTPLASVDIAPHKYTRFTKISEELLNDSAVNIVDFLASRYGRAVATLENTLFMTNNDDGDPSAEGVTIGGTAGLTLDSASTIGAAEIPELYHKLGSQYADGAVWFMRNATLGVLRGLYSSSVFSFAPTPGASAGGEELWGKRIFLTDAVAAIGTSAKSLIIGNPEFYMIVDNGTMVVQRNPYLYMANGQVGFFASVRVSGAVLQAEAWQYATHPTS